MQTAAFKPETYARKSFNVEAIQVSSANMQDVAKWCGGKVQSEQRGKKTVNYIYVEVVRAANERQKKAYVGDWVLKAGTGFKCFTPQAFDDGFERPISALAEKYAPGQV